MFGGIGNPAPDLFSVCVCVCVRESVCEREREGKREREGWSLSCGLKCNGIVGWTVVVSAELGLIFPVLKLERRSVQKPF